MKTWFSSDYHFNHTNILKYENRQFVNIDAMNNAIIKGHNERVKKDDIVYFLGDFLFYASKNREFRGEGKPGDPDYFLNQMNGKQWYFVSGNHDGNHNKVKAKASEIILRQNKLKIQLIHDPKYAKIDYDFILCGHVHSKWKVKELFYLGQSRIIINCGIDANKMKPISLDEVLSIYYRWKNQREKIGRWETPQIINEMNKGFGNGI